MWLYLKMAATSVRSQMQYRMSFLLMLVGNLFISGIEFLGLWALFVRFGSLRGWSLPEVALFYGMVHVAFALAETLGAGFDFFPALVRDGGFDRVLLRPRDSALLVAGNLLRIKNAGRLVQGLAVLAWAGWRLHVHWSPGRLLFMGLAILGGAAIFAGLFVLQATLSFWTIDGLEVVNTVTYGGVETAQYPLAIYRRWFRLFFTFVIPLACINYLPALVILGRPAPLGMPRWAPWLSPGFGVVFLWLCLCVWHFGVRHYRSTGS